MLRAIILICGLSGPCTPETAIDVMRTPVESWNPVTCFMQGQAFLAQTEIGRSLGADQQVSIKCEREKGTP